MVHSLEVKDRVKDGAFHRQISFGGDGVHQQAQGILGQEKVPFCETIKEGTGMGEGIATLRDFCGD